MALSEQLRNAERKRLSEMDDNKLNGLLLQQFNMDDADRDADYMHLILETLEDREDTPVPDTEKALQQFYSDYCEQTNSSSDEEQTPKVRSRVLRGFIIAAVIVTLLIATTSAVLIPTVSRTPNYKDTLFTFGFDDDDAYMYVDTPFYDLRKQVKPYCTAPIVPNYDPNKSIPSSISGKLEDYGFTITGLYESRTKSITLHYIFYNSEEERAKYNSATDLSVAKEYEVNGIIHYIIESENECTILWSNGLADCAIYGDFTVDNAELMICSIYSALPELARATKLLSDAPLAPKYIPFKCTLVKEVIEVNEEDLNGESTVFIAYNSDSADVSFLYSLEGSAHKDNGSLRYFIDEGSTEEYVVNGITHYVSTHNGSPTVLWYNGDILCIFWCDTTREEAKRMIDSIYE